jgi:hypothetical protein
MGTIIASPASSRVTHEQVAWGASGVDRLVTAELRFTRAARALSRSGAYRGSLGSNRRVWLLSVSFYGSILKEIKGNS